MERLRVGALLLMALSQGLTACDATSLIVSLAEHDCRTDAAVRVSSERTAILFITTHVYVPSDTRDWDAYRQFANDVIPPILDDVNVYLETAGFNVVLSRERSLVYGAPHMAPVELTEGGFPLPASRVWLKEAARRDLSNLHAHWSPASTSSGVAGYGGGEVEAVGEPPLMWLGLIENPLGEPRTAEQRSRGFAHELGHVFGLPHEYDDPENLMNPGTLGDDVTNWQIQTFWNSFNTNHPNFEVISCLKDPAVRRLVTQHTSQELQGAAR
jgi:hypothetical protein